MKPVSFLYLSQMDVMSLGIDMSEVVDTMEACMASKAKGLIENPPKPGVHVLSDSFIHAMPGYVKDMDTCGVKWVSGYPTNRKLGYPQIFGLLILNDTQTGLPLSVMDCQWITAMRTAAISGVTARYLAKKDSEIIGLIGAGVQGRYNLWALKTVLPNFKKAKIFDINVDAAKKCGEEMSGKLGIEYEIVGSVEEAVRNSDVVVTATQRIPDPIVFDEWLKDGVLGMGLEGGRAWSADSFGNADKFSVDDIGQARMYDSNGSFPGGMPEPYAELGEIVIGKKPARENDKEKILGFNTGLAIDDMALAKVVFERAKEKGIGVTLPLMVEDL